MFGGGGGSYTGDFERWMKEGSLLLSKARNWASFSIGDPLLGNMDGRFFLRVFLLEEFLLGIL